MHVTIVYDLVRRWFVEVNIYNEEAIYKAADC